MVKVVGGAVTGWECTKIGFFLMEEYLSFYPLIELVGNYFNRFFKTSTS